MITRILWFVLVMLSGAFLTLVFDFSLRQVGWDFLTLRVLFAAWILAGSFTVGIKGPGVMRSYE